MIKEWAWEFTDEELDKETDENIFKNEKYDVARKCLILNLIQYNMFVEPKRIKVENVRSGIDYKSQIIWVKGPATFIRFLIVRAAEIKDSKVITKISLPPTCMSGFQNQRSSERFLKTQLKHLQKH